MKYTFKAAKKEEIPEIFSLYLERIQWMDDKGIQQWNNNGYLEVYTETYYEEQQKNGRLFVLKDDAGKCVAAAVLLDEDARWEEIEKQSSCFVHNLVTSCKVKGAGRQMLAELEKVTASRGRKYIRLDCSDDNPFLNQYYQSQGYEKNGFCQDGPYKGIRREKRVL